MMAENIVSPINSEPSISPLISVSIVSHGQTALVMRLLQSISVHETTQNIEIILTENQSSDIVDTEQLTYQNLRQVINPEPKGFGANHNQASKIARGEYFCILNPDVVFVEGLFSPLIDLISQGKGDIVAPLIVDSQQEIQDSFRPIPTPWKLLLRQFQPKENLSSSIMSEVLYPEWIAAIVLFMRLDTFNSMGGFDEKFRLYFEDVDFGIRARLHNFRLLLDTKLSVVHDAGRMSRRNLRYFLLHLFSAARFFRSEIYRQAKKG